MNFYHFDKFGLFHIFWTITKLNIPRKVPHLLALDHPLFLDPMQQYNLSSDFRLQIQENAT